MLGCQVALSMAAECPMGHCAAALCWHRDSAICADGMESCFLQYCNLLGIRPIMFV